MDFENLIVEQKEHVSWITINRATALNSITSDMHAELQNAIDAFAADDNQHICVITGVGEKAFCAGSDLKEAIDNNFRTNYPQSGYAGLIERYDLNKPVIAAVNGIAYGGGFELALSCDLIIACETATFSLPEPRVGAVALGSGLHRLPRQIGLKKAMGYILSSRTMNASEAFDLGLVNEVAKQGELTEVVEQWCKDIQKAAPISIRASKEAVMRGLDELSVKDAIKNQESYPLFKQWRGAEDTKEGPIAFADKREPVWQNK